MVHSLNWGVVSTISTRSDVLSSSSAGDIPIPFGNVYSFADGMCDLSSSSGVPYLYGTILDQTVQDIEENPIVSLALTEASIQSPTFSSCNLSEHGDPENPPCARLVITGKFVKVTSQEELDFAKQALFSRHPAMKYWPSNHEFFVGKIEIEDLWFLDWFGGASILNIEDYYGASLESLKMKSKI